MSGEMRAYIVRRVLMLFPLLIGLSLVMFLLLRLAPGDPATAIDVPRQLNNPEFVEQTRKNLGLDEPVVVQYGYLVAEPGDRRSGNRLRLQPETRARPDRRADWGTIQLQGAALIIGLMIAIPVGIISATRQYSLWDNSVTVGSFIGLALPELLAGAAAPGLARGEAGPASRSSAPGRPMPTGRSAGSISYCRYWCWRLPTIAYFARFMRSSMLEVINQDYVTTARAKGLCQSQCALRSCPPQCAVADGDRGRSAIAANPRRRGHHRANLRLAGRWPARLGCDRQARLSGNPRDHDDRRGRNHGRRPCSLTSSTCCSTRASPWQEGPMPEHAATIPNPGRTPTAPGNARPRRTTQAIDRVAAPQAEQAGRRWHRRAGLLLPDRHFSAAGSRRTPTTRSPPGCATQPPSMDHWMGTDRSGRDVFSRLIKGGQVSLAAGFMAVAIVMLIGVTLGRDRRFLRGLGRSIRDAVHRYPARDSVDPAADHGGLAVPAQPEDDDHRDRRCRRGRAPRGSCAGSSWPSRARSS